MGLAPENFSFFFSYLLGRVVHVRACVGAILEELNSQRSSGNENEMRKGEKTEYPNPIFFCFYHFFPSISHPHMIRHSQSDRQTFPAAGFTMDAFFDGRPFCCGRVKHTSAGIDSISWGIFSARFDWKWEVFTWQEKQMWNWFFDCSTGADLPP